MGEIVRIIMLNKSKQLTAATTSNTSTQSREFTSGIFDGSVNTFTTTNTITATNNSANSFTPINKSEM